MAHPHEDTWLDLAEGTLSGDDARAAEAHLAGCAACRGAQQRIAAEHRLALRAARTLAAAPAPAAPRAVGERLAAELRRDAAAAPRRVAPRAWALGGALAACAAAGVALLVAHPAHREGPGAIAMRSALAVLAAPAGVTRGADPLDLRAAEVAAAWRAGRLRAEGVELRCPAGALSVEALADGRGAIALLAVTAGDRSDLHLYGDDGAELGSARVASGARAAFVLPPLGQAEARAALAHPVCPAP